MRSNDSIGYLDGAMMGAAYSVDLRRKVVQAYERGMGSQANVAQFFGVSLSFFEKLLRLHRRTGQASPDGFDAGLTVALALQETAEAGDEAYHGI